MDRNTIIGFVLIGVLLIGYLTISNIQNQDRLAIEAAAQRKKDSVRIADSIKNVKLNPVVKIPNKDSVAQSATSDLSMGLQDTSMQERKFTLENDLMKISFSNKGGFAETVLLKKFVDHQKRNIILGNTGKSSVYYDLNLSSGNSITSNKLFYKVDTSAAVSGDTKTIKFYLSDSTGKTVISHDYSIKNGSYLIDFNINYQGAEHLFAKKNSLDLIWSAESPKAEEDSKYELSQAHICYKEGGDFDFDNMIRSDTNMNFSKPTDWIAVKQQFFIQAFIAKNKFTTANTKWHVSSAPSDNYLAQTTTVAHCELSGATAGSVPFQFYMGPSDYHELKKYGNDLEKIVPYGSGIFAFVKYINRHFLLPVFDFLRNYISSLGMVILLLTLFIRLLTSPILYKSYLSGAKMKVLKPEIDALKAKYKDDQQAFGMEQMKLWKSAGVNPLGGCLPALLQIPIFMSLYYFFQANIGLRGASFLWAKDLSQYDVIAKFSFSIPFYGDHISLFTLTAVITSLLISLYGMSNMQDNSNPLMKYMPYIFPILLLGVFNNLPSALTWYYTISNTITLVLQIVIQKYIINHEKIIAEIKENMKKPVKKSKMQERIEAMQESQRKLQELKNKKSS